MLVEVWSLGHVLVLPIQIEISYCYKAIPRCLNPKIHIKPVYNILMETIGITHR